MYHGRDELPRVWEDRFQPTYGVLRDEVLETFDEYLNCGLLQHGAARVYCDTCKHSLLVAFSCKKSELRLAGYVGTSEEDHAEASCVGGRGLVYVL